jgi:hypothetical protein
VAKVLPNTGMQGGNATLGPKELAEGAEGYLPCDLPHSHPPALTFRGHGEAIEIEGNGGRQVAVPSRGAALDQSA